LKVCFFVGSYTIKNEEGLWKKILEMQNVEVIECREKIHSVLSFFSANLKMFFRHIALNYDVMIIPAWGIFTFPLARILTRKPIIYWSNLSLYHSLVIDREKDPNSIYAKLVHFAEKFVCKHSDMVITESAAQANYLQMEYKVDKKKFRNSINGVDETKFMKLPFKPSEKMFYVLFFGSFVPAHGTEFIIEAAKILQNNEDIFFYMYGDGPMKKSTEKQAERFQLKNVEFFGFFEYCDLISIIRKCDVILGLFGKSEKAANVIPSKVLQSLALQKPLITMESKAIREIQLEDENNCLLVPSGDPEMIANAILALKNDPTKRKRITENGYQLYKENLSMEKTGKKLLRFIEEAKVMKIK